MRIPDGELERWLEEDVPYLDLTTHLLGIGARPGRIRCLLRHEGTAACTEEAARLFEMAGATARAAVPSGRAVEAGALLVEGEGTAEALHRGWKAAQNLLEYTCGIAGETRKLREAAEAVAPGIPVLTTRKTPPGMKRAAVKAVLAGGGALHRLGISETVLVFDEHMAFCGGLEGFVRMLGGLEKKALEKPIVAECHDEASAFLLAEAGVKLLQVDKMASERLGEMMATMRIRFPSVRVLAAGGINAANAGAYAAAGVHGLVTSAPYHAKAADVKVELFPV